MDELHQRIVSAAYPLFVHRGIRDVTLDDVQQAAGVTASELSREFPSRDAIAAECLALREQEWTVGVVEAGARARASSPEAFVGDAYLAFFGYVAREPAMFRLIRRNADTIPVITEDPALGAVLLDLAEDLGAAIDRGDLPRFDVELMAAAMAGAGLELAARMLEREPVEVEATATFATELFLGAIGRLRRSER
ncbi:MAG: hypothetical protein QOE53_3073 [Pseudonocardiales bacterium]|nr:hypothetical protein [Pseudonocardiales bacterium]